MNFFPISGAYRTLPVTEKCKICGWESLCNDEGECWLCENDKEQDEIADS
jgi:hypothetical protein